MGGEKKSMAQADLGNSYLLGKNGVKKDAKRAIILYSLAAEQGHASAQFNLGVMYLNGNGTKPDIKRASAEQV